MKIEPNYRGPTVHVLDASRAVGVASTLLSDTLRDDFVIGVRKEYQDIRTARGSRKAEERHQTIAAARKNRLAIDWDPDRAPEPCRLGITVLDDYPLGELVSRIDWTPFFQTWELAGHYPAILNDPVLGPAASSLFRDAQELLDRIVRERLLRARGVFGFFPANSVGDDIELYTDKPLGEAGRGRPHHPAADGQAAGPAQPRPGRLRGPTGERRGRLRRSLRGDGGRGHRRAGGRASRPPTTTTTRS